MKLQYEKDRCSKTKVHSQVPSASRLSFLSICFTISPGANLAGDVVVGKRTYVGMGAIVLEKRRIGEQSIIGAAAVVTRDVPDRVKAMGMPARIIAKNVEGL